MTVPSIGALMVISGLISALALDACHLGLAAADEHAQAVARGRQRRPLRS